MKNIITHHTLKMLVLMSLTGNVLAAYHPDEEDDVKIIQSDASGFVMEYHPQFSSTPSVVYDGKEYYNVLFEGAVLDESVGAGSPALYYRTVVVRFPGSKNNSLEIVNVGYEDLSNVLVSPVPELLEDSISLKKKYSLNERAYSSTVFVPAQVAHLLNVGETRGVFLGSVRLYPYQYMSGLKKLRKYNRIVVRVNFGAAEQPTTLPDDLVKNIAINSSGFTMKEREVSPRTASVFRNSVLASGEWFKFPVTEEGMYKLSGQVLLAAGIPASVDPRTIKIYGNGGFELPLSPVAPAADDLLENAIYSFDARGNHQLDPEDYIIFFAKGTRGWTYHPTTKTFSHYINRYAETNYYWLTYGGALAKQMTPVPSSVLPTEYRPTTVGGKLFREDEKINILNSGLEWLGQVFSSGTSMTYIHSLPGVDTSQPIQYKFRLGARSSTSSTFTIDDHGTQIVNVGLGSTLIGNYNDRQIKDATVQRSILPTFIQDNYLRLRFTFTTTGAGGTGYLDWYEVHYARFLNAQNDELSFHTKDTSAIAEYSVNGFSSNQILVFDVTRFDSVLLLTNVRTDANRCMFRTELLEGTAKQFYVVGENGFRTPSPLTRVPNQNLHGDTTEVDYIIVTHSDFFSAAQRLKTHRERPGADRLRTRVVEVDQVYNEFGGGLSSPMAIRNYLKYVYTNQTVPPKYVLLFGDGDFDYKRIITSGPNWIPPFETPESFDLIYSYATDDEFAYVNSSQRVQMSVGRLCVRSLSEAAAIVEKIIEYETNPVRDPWKVRVTLVADDGLTSEGNDGVIHTEDSELLSRLVPSLFELKKIYLYQYPTTYTSTGRRKPGVNRDIISQINEGTLVLNFTGHGNPRLWTHEQVFVRETDFSQLQNSRKYFFLVAATCNFSDFDKTGEQSGGELLVTMPNAGAIGVFSATRAVYQNPNRYLNQDLYRELFRQSADGSLIPLRVGDAVFKVKQSYRSFDNDRKYFLLGDPALRFALPKAFVTVDSIDHQSGTQTVTLGALRRVRMIGTVQDSTQQTGTAAVVVYDADKSFTIVDGRPLNVMMNGDVIFRGEHNVRNGSLVSNFIVPKDISYSNNNGRVTVYFWNDATDGAGYTRNIIIGGTDTTAPPDTKGPQIQLYLDSRSFRMGDVVSSTPMLIADLFDSSGINTSNAGVGHRIEAWLDNSSQSIDLTNFYKSKIDTYQEGTIEYRLNGLSEGSHRLLLRAWDTYNNSSTTETIFDVGTSVGLQVFNVHNYPNPFSSYTVFTFEHNQPSAVDAEVKIYTVSGRLIQSLHRFSIVEKVGKIMWDGRDRDGDAIANGVYLYKVIVRTSDGRFANETINKLSVLK
jgi:hypothetical protein